MIPVCEPFLTGLEVEYANDAIQSGWISSQGAYIDRFEHAFADYIGVTYATTTSSGTASLHLALRACSIQPGDEVIVPSFAMAACANSVCYCGARPVFVDCSPDTWTINPDEIVKKITPRTKAIMIVHIYGHPVDYAPIAEIASSAKLTVIEDAAEALGSMYLDKKCGSLSTISCFSLYANKMITCGEGGIVCTNNKKLYNHVRYLKNQAFSSVQSKRFVHNDIGFNYRLTNMQAAIALAQLTNIDKFISLRRDHANEYFKKLSGIPGLTMPVEKVWAKNSYWMFGILIGKEFPFSRNTLMTMLRDGNDSIETRPFFSPLHLQKSMIRYGAVCDGEYPVAERISRCGLYLPSGSGLLKKQIEVVCNKIIKIAGLI